MQILCSKTFMDRIKTMNGLLLAFVSYVSCFRSSRPATIIHYNTMDRCRAPVKMNEAAANSHVGGLDLSSTACFGKGCVVLMWYPFRARGASCHVLHGVFRYESHVCTLQALLHMRVVVLGVWCREVGVGPAYGKGGYQRLRLGCNRENSASLLAFMVIVSFSKLGA